MESERRLINFICGAGRVARYRQRIIDRTARNTRANKLFDFRFQGRKPVWKTYRRFKETVVNRFNLGREQEPLIARRRRAKARHAR